MKTFAERLKEARELAGLKQQEVADYIKKSVMTYQRYENGSTEPNAAVLKLLNEILTIGGEGKSYTLEELGGVVLQTNAIVGVTLEAVAELLCQSSGKSFAEVRGSLEAAVKQRLEGK